MFKIVSKKMFSEKVACFEVEAPLIAQSRKAGHFVIVRLDEKGERIPLTIADADTEKGTITLVVQAVGASSTRISPSCKSFAPRTRRKANQRCAQQARRCLGG